VCVGHCIPHYDAAWIFLYFHGASRQAPQRTLRRARSLLKGPGQLNWRLASWTGPCCRAQRSVGVGSKHRAKHYFSWQRLGC
jgi:hypothetical protein